MNINPHNRLELEGRIAYTKEYSAGKAATICIAIDNGKTANGANKEPSYISVKSFAPSVYNTVSVGMKIRVFGHVATSQYEKQGQKIYSTDLIADYIEFLESKSTIMAREFNKICNEM